LAQAAPLRTFSCVLIDTSSYQISRRFEAAAWRRPQMVRSGTVREVRFQEPETQHVDEERQSGTRLVGTHGRAADEAHPVDGSDADKGPCAHANTLAHRRRRRRPRRTRQAGAHTAESRSNAVQPVEYDANEMAVEADAYADLRSRLEVGGKEQLAAIGDLRGSVWRLSSEDKGCRAIQRALEVCDQKLAAELVIELHGHVEEAYQSPHANHVIQRVIELLPTRIAGFIVEELGGIGLKVSCHRYGCRIISRLLEHAASDERTSGLIDEILQDAEELCRHMFGHHVAQSVLEHGMTSHKKQVISSIRKELVKKATHRNTSYVIEKALTHIDEEDKSMLANLLVTCDQSTPPDQIFNNCIAKDKIATLASTQYGCFVLRTLVRMRQVDTKSVVSCIHSLKEHLNESKHGRRLLESMTNVPSGDHT